MGVFERAQNAAEESPILRSQISGDASFVTSISFDLIKMVAVACRRIPSGFWPYLTIYPADLHQTQGGHSQ
jgi:hypothetical protein